MGRHAAAWFPRILSDKDLDDPLQKRHHFERARLAVAYRYRSCSDYNEEFKALLREASDLWREWGDDEEQNYRLERCLYGFFVSGLSVFESFAFSLYFIGAAMRPEDFPNIAQPRKITLEKTAKAFTAAFPNASITRHLAELPDASAFEKLDTVRNILAHRLTGRRNIRVYNTVHPDGPHRREEVWNLPGSDKELVFDEQLIQHHLGEVTELLETLITASLEFVTNHKPEAASA